jgi:ketosteroid isomerase-like protein
LPEREDRGRATRRSRGDFGSHGGSHCGAESRGYLLALDRSRYDLTDRVGRRGVQRARPGYRASPLPERNLHRRESEGVGEICKLLAALAVGRGLSRDTARAMSEENVKALRRALSVAINEPEDFFALFDEDIVWDPGEVFPAGKAYGREGVRKFFRQWAGTWDELSLEVIEVIDGDSGVFVHQRQKGRGKGSGIVTEVDFWQVYVFFEGKVIRFAQKSDRETALKAAGVSE